MVQLQVYYDMQIPVWKIYGTYLESKIVVTTNLSCKMFHAIQTLRHNIVHLQKLYTQIYHSLFSQETV